jgi:RNA polymerase sigma-70 factor (ECF subfamily)
MIDRLPTVYRRALVLTELQGLTQRRAAAVEAVSLSGLKSRVQRGRRLLKRMVLEACGIEVDRRGGVVACTPRTVCGCRQGD